MFGSCYYFRLFHAKRASPSGSSSVVESSTTSNASSPYMACISSLYAFSFIALATIFFLSVNEFKFSSCSGSVMPPINAGLIYFIVADARNFFDQDLYSAFSQLNGMTRIDFSLESFILTFSFSFTLHLS